MVLAEQGSHSGVRAGPGLGQDRTGVRAGPGSGQDRAGSGPRVVSGPHCGGLALPSAPESGTAGQAGRGRGHADQEVGILLLHVCLGSFRSLDRLEHKQILKELERNQI